MLINDNNSKIKISFRNYSCDVKNMLKNNWIILILFVCIRFKVVVIIGFEYENR